MKSLVVYYSETGNPQNVAQAVAAGLGTQAMRIEDVETRILPDYDLICMGTPVQRGAPAKKVLDFIAQMPDMNGKKAAVCCTMHLTGDKKAIQILKKTLEARGMVFLGGFSALGWSRLIANFGPRIFNHSRPNRDELARAEEFGRNLLAKMQAATNNFHWLISAVALSKAISLIARFYPANRAGGSYGGTPPSSFPAM